MAAIDIITNARIPRTFNFKELTYLPIIFLLLEMWSMIAIKTGAVRPYSMAVYNNALIGESPM